MLALAAKLLFRQPDPSCFTDARAFMRTKHDPVRCPYTGMKDSIKHLYQSHENANPGDTASWKMSCLSIIGSYHSVRPVREHSTSVFGILI